MIFEKYLKLFVKNKFKLKTFMIENLPNLALRPPSLELKIDLEKMQKYGKDVYDKIGKSVKEQFVNAFKILNLPERTNPKTILLGICNMIDFLYNNFIDGKS